MTLFNIIFYRFILRLCTCHFPIKGYLTWLDFYLIFSSPSRTTKAEPASSETSNLSVALDDSVDSDKNSHAGSFRRRSNRKDRLLRCVTFCKVDPAEPIVYPTTPETILEYHKARLLVSCFYPLVFSRSYCYTVWSAIGSYCCPSVCDAVHCGSPGWCTRLKVASACS